MTPVFFIKVKVGPCLERSFFFYYKYDNAEVVHNVFLIRVQYTSASSLVVTPLGKFGRNMVVRIPCKFADEGYLSCCDLFFNVGYVQEFLPR